VGLVLGRDAGSMDIRGHDLTNTKKYREIARSGRAARF
jgi:hypothetical protein